MVTAFTPAVFALLTFVAKSATLADNRAHFAAVAVITYDRTFGTSVTVAANTAGTIAARATGTAKVGAFAADTASKAVFLGTFITFAAQGTKVECTITAHIAVTAHFTGTFVTYVAVRTRVIGTALAHVTYGAERGTILAFATALTEKYVLVTRTALKTVIFVVAGSSAFLAAMIAARTYVVVTADRAAIFALDDIIPSVRMLCRQQPDQPDQHDEAE